MEKIYFDDETYIWRTKFDISHIKDDVLKECFSIMEEIGEFLFKYNIGISIDTIKKNFTEGEIEIED